MPIISALYLRLSRDDDASPSPPSVSLAGFSDREPLQARVWKPAETRRELRDQVRGRCSLLLTVLLQEAANRGLTRSAKLCFEMNVWKLFRIFTGEQGSFSWPLLHLLLLWRISDWKL